MQATALLSAYTKSDKLADFARALRNHGWNILASAGTKKFLDAEGVRSTDIGDLVGEPILGHRVVTLDRKIYAGILADKNNPEHMQELKRIGVDPIDLVYVDLYPLADELRRTGRTIASVIEKIDIGGPTLLRAAAKGGCYTLSNQEQLDEVLRIIRDPHHHPADPSFLAWLAAEAEETVSNYASLAESFYRSVEKSAFPVCIAS